MASLTLKAGTKVEAENGNVTVFGSSVALFGSLKNGDKVLQVAYAMQPGEIVRRVGEGEDYVVEY